MSPAPALLLSMFLLLATSYGSKIPKCCPLGQLLFSGVCVDMKGGAELPKIRMAGSLVTFQWLKDQQMLTEGFSPKCIDSGEVFPDFKETATSEANLPHFTKDGVFIHELMYFRPEDYCVDGELDSYEYQEEMYGEEEEDYEAEDVSYIKVKLCEERAESMGGCEDEGENCYPR